MNEINLKLVTKQIESKSIKTRFKIIYEEPELDMTDSVYRWYLSKFKTKNMVDRLKNKRK
jgi:hypothetical protein